MKTEKEILENLNVILESKKRGSKLKNQIDEYNNLNERVEQQIGSKVAIFENLNRVIDEIEFVKNVVRHDGKIYSFSFLNKEIKIPNLEEREEMSFPRSFLDEGFEIVSQDSFIIDYLREKDKKQLEGKYENAEDLEKFLDEKYANFVPSNADREGFKGRFHNSHRHLSRYFTLYDTTLYNVNFTEKTIKEKFGDTTIEELQAKEKECYALAEHLFEGLASKPELLETLKSIRNNDSYSNEVRELAGVVSELNEAKKNNKPKK